MGCWIARLSLNDTRDVMDSATDRWVYGQSQRTHAARQEIRTFSGFDSKSRVGVVLSNYNSVYGIDDIGRHLLNPKALADDGSRVKPQERTAVTLPVEFLDKIRRPLSFLRGRHIWTVRCDGTRFFIKKPSEPEFEILPKAISPKATTTSFRGAPTRYSPSTSRKTIRAWHAS